MVGFRCAQCGVESLLYYNVAICDVIIIVVVNHEQVTFALVVLGAPRDAVRLLELVESFFHLVIWQRNKYGPWWDEQNGHVLILGLLCVCENCFDT